MERITDLDRKVYSELNTARTNPQGYSRVLEQTLSQYEGKRLRVEGQPAIQTVEGKDAVVEAINFLKTQAKLSPFACYPGMCDAARAHAEDIGANGLLQHEGSDGSVCADRVARFGTWMGTVGENISFGTATARRLIVKMLVDDGVPDRGHRKNVFTPEYGCVGIACAPHSVMDTVCVVNFAGDFTEGSPKVQVSENVCAGCAKTFQPSEPGITAMETSWHPKCFCCSACGREVKGDFTARGGKPVCSACTAQESSSCQSCGEDLGDKSVVALSASWHAECFVCAGCSSAFENGRFVEVDSRPYCSNACVPASEARGEDVRTCHRCQQALERDVVSALDRLWHVECFVCDRCGKTFPDGQYSVLDDRAYCGEICAFGTAESCSGCSTPVGGSSLKALGASWHEDCFKCKECESPMSGDFVSRDGFPFCNAHCSGSEMARRSDSSPAIPLALAPDCHGCGKPLAGDSAEALGHVWHTRCLVCACCGRVLPGAFVVHQGKAFCDSSCVGGQPSGKVYVEVNCASCGLPLDATYTRADGVAFHPSCFTCTTCFAVLSDVPYRLKGVVPYCGKHYAALFLKQCEICDAPLGERFVEALGSRFHTQCFKCADCDGVLDGEQGQFVVAGRNAFCSIYCLQNSQRNDPAFAKLQDVIDSIPDSPKTEQREVLK